MPEIVTSEEFITSVLCELALKGQRELSLESTLVDDRFERAYEDLIAALPKLGIRADFTLTTNQYHGDSGTLRETLYAIRDRGVVAINNPSFKTVEFKLSEAEAQRRINRSSVPQTLLEEIVRRHFGVGEQKIELRQGGRRASATA